MAPFHKKFAPVLNSLYLVLFGTLVFNAAVIRGSTSLDKLSVEKPTQRVSLFVGGSKEITIPWRRNIQVSRRGIIFLQHIAEDKWRVTALRSGLVMINGDSQRHSAPLFIQVLATENSPKKPLMPAGQTLGNDIKQTNEIPEQRVLIRAYVTLIENSNSEISGVKVRPSIEVALGAAKPTFSWKNQVAPMSASQSSNTVAAPVFNMFTGSTSTAHSGGEFMVQYTTDKSPDVSREGWKEHGFRLSITPEIDGSDLILTYGMSLKVLVSGGSTPNLSSNDLNGSLQLKKNEMTIAGVINFSGTGNETRSALNQIPIVGPLFTDRSNDLSKKRLVLWFLYEDPSNLIEGFGTPQEPIAPN